MSKYRNRYGDIFTFTLVDDNTLMWEGDFKYFRRLINDDDSTYAIDPSGGPFISLETDLSWFCDDIKDETYAESIEWTDGFVREGFVTIKLKKNK